MSFVDKLINDWPLGPGALDILRTNQDLEKMCRADAMSDSRANYAPVAVTYAALKHFGFDTTTEPLRRLFSEAVHKSHEHYWGDWWHPEQTRAWCAAKGMSDVDAEWEVRSNAQLAPDYPGERDLDRRGLVTTMLAASFVGMWDELAKICNWFNTKLSLEYCDGVREDEYQYGLLYMASLLREQPMPGIDKLVAKIEKCRHKQAKALLRLIRAAFDANQQELDETLPESIDLYYKKRDPLDLIDLIALEQSVLAQIARRNGLVLPKLKEKQHWALMTPESIQLEAT